MKKVRRRFVPGNYKLKVGRSQTGRGLFAAEAIPRGACIIEYTGRPLSEAEQYGRQGKYYFETGRGTMIDGNIPSNTAKYINHSCAPNCEIDLKDRRVYVFAKRAIKPGEELSYDYGEEYFDMFFKNGGCKCPACTRKRKA